MLEELEKSNFELNPNDTIEFDSGREVIGPQPRPSEEMEDLLIEKEKKIDRPDELKVKVFIINEDGNWSDCGIGTLIFLSMTEIVVCSDDNDLKERDVIAPDRAKKLRGGHGTSSLEVMNMDRGELLVNLDLNSAKDFMKTQTTIISWDQMDINENIALSFIYSYDCLSVWKYICNLFDIQMEEEVELFTISKEELTPITEYLSKMDFYEEEKKKILYSFCYKEMMFDKTRATFEQAKTESDIETMVKIGRLIEAIISCCNADLNLKMFNDPLWPLVFEALEYTEDNYDPITGKKKHSYLEFLNNGSKMKFVDKGSLINGFEDLVKLRFRVQFYMEYVISNKGPNPEVIANHFQMIMQTLNVHLLDYLMTDDFIVKSLYPQDEAAKLKVSGFASEFFALYKGLTNAVKIDISQSFRQKNIGKYAISQIHDLLLESSSAPKEPKNSAQIFKIELSSAKTMEENYKKNLKKLVLAHLEILYISCRREKTYAYELFREFEHTQETIELLLEFPDDSPFDIFIELLFPKGDPFSCPQLLLISILGVSTLEGVCSRLEDKVNKRRERTEQPASAEDIEEESKIEVKYFYRLVLYLSTCMSSMAPGTITKLAEMDIGGFLTRMLREIDPKLLYKNLHFSLTKFFLMLVGDPENQDTQQSQEIQELCINCDFIMDLYKKYSRRNNLISSQNMLAFKRMGFKWNVACRDFVKRHKDEIVKLKNEGDDVVAELTMHILDWNDNVVETNSKADLDFGSQSINSKPSTTNFNFQEEEPTIYSMICNSPEAEKKQDSVTLPSLSFPFEESKGKDDFIISSTIGKESPGKMNKQFTLGSNEAVSTFEDEEENEAKQKLKSLLANMKKKGSEDNDGSDITSFLNNSEDDYSESFDEPKRLTFKFLNTAIEDEDDDDGLLPAIKVNDPGFMENEIDDVMSLGKRMDPFGQESNKFDDHVEKKLKI